MENDIIKALPEMLSGDALLTALAVFPSYNKSICKEEQSTRLIALSDIYKVFVPSQMAMEIYSKLYLSLLRSLQKKNTKTAIQQQYENRKAIKELEYSGIIGGSDSFTIIGTSGIGKSSAISRAMSLIMKNQIIETKHLKIIPCITVQCPFDASVKGLLLEILRKVDEKLSTNYYVAAIRAKATIDMLIGSVSQVALNHIGILIVDEIQNIVTSKNGKNLIGALTQLINNSGISIAMVGTPDCSSFFESAMQLARRSVGLYYSTIPYDTYFENFCKIIFQYQYTKYPAKLTPTIMQWLYEHSMGVISIVVLLIESAQEIAIMNGVETINIAMLDAAYTKRLEFLHGFIKEKKNKPINRIKKTENFVSVEINEVDNIVTIAELVKRAKENGEDVVDLMKLHFPILEVTI